MRPDDDYLARSVAAAFDRLPEPEAARLEALERRLTLRAPVAARRSKGRLGFWWLMAGLVATGAAAWWGGAYRRDAAPKPLPRAAARAGTDAAKSGSEPDAARETGKTSSQDEATESETNSQTIYRREVY
jgi:hypothetical protein